MPMLGSRKITLQFSVNWLIGIVSVALAHLAAFIWGPESWHQSLIFSAAVLGGSGTLIAALNALDTRVASLEQAKKATALDFINRWNDPSFYHAKKGGREILEEIKKVSTVDEQWKYVQADPVRLANLISVLNFFETVSIGIQTGLADGPLAKQFFRAIALEYWRQTEGMVKKRRADRGNDRLFHEFECLYGQWKG